MLVKFLIISNAVIGTGLYLWGIPFHRLFLPSVIISLIFSTYMTRLYKLHHKEIKMLNYLSAYKSMLYELSKQKEFEQINMILKEHKEWHEEEDGIMIKISTITKENGFKSLKIEAGYKNKNKIKSLYFQRALISCKS